MLEKIIKILEWGTPSENLQLDISFGLTEKLEQPIIDFILNQISNITGLLIDTMLSAPLYFLRLQEFSSIHLLITKLALAAILPFVAWQGFKLMSNMITVEQLQESLKRVLLMPLFALLSPPLITSILSIVNQISITLLNTTTGAEQAFRPKTLEITLIIFVGIYLYLMVKLLLYYSFRNFAIIFLIAFSPALYLVWSIPGKFDKLDVWINELSSLFLTQVIHVIELLLLLSLVRISSAGFQGLLIQIGALLFMVETPDWLGKYIDNSTKIPNIKFSSPKKIIRSVTNVFKP
ncbi:MAG: hypothetical protein ACOCRK_06530 [bacterium]